MVDIAEMSFSADPKAFLSERQHLAWLMARTGDEAGAAKMYRSTMDMAHSVLDPGDIRHSGLLSSFGDRLFDQGKLTEASEMYRDAVAHEREYGEDRPDETAYVLSNYASFLEHRQRYDEAEDVLEEAFDLVKRGREADELETAQQALKLAQFYHRQDQHNDAAKWFDRAVFFSEDAVGTRSIEYARILRAYVYYLIDKQEFEEAATHLATAKKINLEAFGPGNYRYGFDLRAEAGLALAQGQLDETVRLYEEADAIRSKEGLQVSGLRRELAIVKAYQGDLDGAHLLLEEIVSREPPKARVDWPALIRAKTYLSRVLTKKGLGPLAETMAREAIENVDAHWPTDTYERGLALAALSNSLRIQGRAGEALSTAEDARSFFSVALKEDEFANAFALEALALAKDELGMSGSEDLGRAIEIVESRAGPTYPYAHELRQLSDQIFAETNSTNN